MEIRLKKGLLVWHYVVVAKNGEIIATSETYFSKSNAKRAAKRLAGAIGVKVK
jgi:uncharacterized protein YegP (UPF0339 family)